MTNKNSGLTVITSHVNADYDSLSSMLAARLLYPDSVTVFQGSQEKGIKNFFVQSIMYLMNLEQPKNIDLDKVDRLVLVDTRQKGRIGLMAELVDGSRDKKVEVHVYDHHPNSPDDVTADVEHIEDIGSTTAMMIRILIEKGIEIDPDAATFLALGIYEDTGSFTFNSTTVADLTAAAKLLELGADLNVVSSLLVRELNADQISLLNQLLQGMQQIRISGVDVTIASCSSDSYQADFAVVAHKLMDMENLDVMFSLAQMENRVHLVARSRIEAVDAGRIARAFGGGGHHSAASATIRDMTLVDIRQRLGVILEAQITPTRMASEIMSYPLISVGPQTPLEQARDTLTRYSINVLLVMNDDDMVGLISRQVIEKALYLGVGEQVVAEYMNPEFVTVRPTSTLAEIQYQIVGERQRILPVLDDDKVVGVITRSDLLNLLMSDPPVPDALAESENGKNYVRQKDLGHIMKEVLPPRPLEILAIMGEVADELKNNAYAVGGFVRDLLLRRANLDLDIVIEGDGVAFARRVAERAGARIRVHEKFRTAVVIFPDGFKVDVATARLEYYESPAALPIVETSSLKLDLYRRDFTINTLAVRINKRHFGMLLDHFGAQRDIKDKSVRLLHSLSLVEDPTRILRAIRFEQRFGFKIGKLTGNLIRNAIRVGAFNEVNPVRLHSELKNILEEENPAKALSRMNDFKLWPAIHQTLAYNNHTDGLIHQIQLVLSWYDMLYVEEKPVRWVVLMLGLFDHLADKTVKTVLNRLAVIPKYQDLIINSRRMARKILAELRKRPDMKPGELYHLLCDASLESLLWAMARKQSDEHRRAFSNYFTVLVKIKPIINGRGLIDMGFEPGPLFRHILDDVRDAKLNGLVKTASDEKKYITDRYIMEN